MKKNTIISICLIGSSILFSLISLIAGSTFVSWLTFVAFGLAIFAFMSHAGNVKNKEKLTLILFISSSVGLVLSIIGIISYINVLQTFISSMV